MANDDRSYLVSELNRQSNDALLVWLEGALQREESRLAVSRTEPLPIGLARLLDALEPHARRGVTQAATHILRRLIAVFNAELADRIETLLYLLSAAARLDPADPAPQAAGEALWTVVLQSDQFQGLTASLQISMLNFLEERPELASIDVWRQLVARDAQLFGAAAFSAVARQSWQQAFSFLPDLPSDSRVVASIRLKLRWLVSIIPADERPNALRLLGETLKQVAPEVRLGVQIGLTDAGFEIPALLPKHFSVLRILEKPAAPRDALSPFGLEELF